MNCKNCGKKILRGCNNRWYHVTAVDGCVVYYDGCNKPQPIENNS